MKLEGRFQYFKSIIFLIIYFSEYEPSGIRFDINNLGKFFVGVVSFIKYVHIFVSK
jgi:hypothetical protein